MAANKRALKAIETTAKASADRIGGKPLHIPVGNLVLLRDHPEGRNKIQDNYKSELFVVADHHADPNVYVIKPVTGSDKLRVINRRQLFDLKRSQAITETEDMDSDPNEVEENVPVVDQVPHYNPKPKQKDLTKTHSHPYNTRLKGKTSAIFCYMPVNSDDEDEVLYTHL